METNIQIFNHEMFGEIRTMTDEKGETFFVGKDVAKALGYSNPLKAIRDHVDVEDKQGERIVHSGYKKNIVKIWRYKIFPLPLHSETVR